MRMSDKACRHFGNSCIGFVKMSALIDELSDLNILILSLATVSLIILRLTSWVLLRCIMALVLPDTLTIAGAIVI